MFKKLLMAGMIAAMISAPGIVFAQAAPAAAKPAEPKPPYTLTGNFGFFSQYIFRGLSQTGHKPAVQGGFDWAHESGFYLGTWASNISWLKENFSAPAAVAGTYGEGGSLEWDFYGGYKWSLPKDVTIDLGTLYYWYPGTINPAAQVFAQGFRSSAPQGDTWEVYVAPSWKWLSAKFSYSVLDHVFANNDARGTWYLDLSANPPLGDSGFTLIAHWGYQKYRGTDPRNAVFAPIFRGFTPNNDTLFTYKDVKLGLSYALPKDFTIGAYYTKAYNDNKLGYGGVFDVVSPGFFGPYPNDIAKGTGTVFIQKTF